MRRTVALEHACRLVNHGPTVLVSAARGGPRNAMAAGRWSLRADNAQLHTLHHLGGGSWGAIGDVVAGEVPEGR